MTHPPPGHVQQHITQVACFKVFSHVVEGIFLLQQDNVIQQALLDFWGASDNRTIYVLLTVPLHSLQITYSRTSDACTTPLKCIQELDYSVASKMCMTIAAAKLPHPIITTLILPHPILTAIAFQYLIIMIGCPQSSHYNTALLLLHVIESLWSHQSVLMMGRSQEHSLVLNTFLRTTLHS
jgi:hypothetical protein